MFTDLSFDQLLGDMGLALAAFVLAFPVGWDRFKQKRPAGLRTFPIVALASCAFVLIGRRAFAEDPGAQARVVQGLMTGIGFVGGGAVLKSDDSDGSHVTGIATAASIWNTGAIGAAVGFLRFELAIVLSATNFLILYWFEPERVETGREAVRDAADEAQAKVDEAREKVSSGRSESEDEDET